MKSILYVGATLMIGASIYGFVDYKKTSRSKEFTGMYETKEPGLNEKKTNPVTGEIKSPVITKEEATKLASEKTAVVTTSTEKKVVSVKKRKLNYKLFSRAPLREDYIIKELKMDTLVEGPKAEKKEQ